MKKIKLNEHLSLFRLCPIFQVSNVTGQNLDLVKSFLNLSNSHIETFNEDLSEFQIHEIYSVPGVGTIVSGTCYKGTIKLNDTLLLGPDLIGQFRPVVIKGIHRKRLPVKECHGNLFIHHISCQYIVSLRY